MGGGGAPRKDSDPGPGGKLERRASVALKIKHRAGTQHSAGRSRRTNEANLTRIHYYGARRGVYRSCGGIGEEEEALTGEILDKFSQLITTALGSWPTLHGTTTPSRPCSSSTSALWEERWQPKSSTLFW